MQATTDGPGDARRQWAGTLAFGPWWLVFDGAFGPTGLHDHHAVQIMLATDPITVAAGDGGRTSGHTIVVPPDVAHAIVDGPPTATIVFVDAESTAGRPYQGRGAPFAATTAAARRRPGELTSFADAELLAAEVLTGLGWHTDITPPRSEPISTALALLPDLDPPEATAAALARRVGLSTSRFTHRFTAEVGLPFRRYRRWSRFVTATGLLADGASLSDAAHTAGFADAAHLTRTFRAHFGVSPTEVLGASRWLGPGHR